MGRNGRIVEPVRKRRSLFRNSKVAEAQKNEGRRITTDDMTLKEAIKICKEMQKWRRAEPPYDFATPNLMPYTAKEYGEALDILIEHAEDE